MAGKLPAIQFYPGDWLRDDVAGCSLAAQALWLRMMFVAHDSSRYGYLEMNGSPMPPEHIARRCGCSLAEYESLLSELVMAGVPRTTEDGILFSKRMVSDAKIRNERAKAGSKGGSKTQAKKKASLKQTSEGEYEVEDESSSRKKKVFEPPTVKEVSDYAYLIGYPQLSAESFVASYEQKGWMVGKNKMKDWKAAVRNWKANGWGKSEPDGIAQLTEDEE